MTTQVYEKEISKPSLAIDVDAIALPRILNPRVDKGTLEDIRLDHVYLHFFFEGSEDQFSLVIEDAADGDIRVKDIEHSINSEDCPFCDHHKRQTMDKIIEAMDQNDEEEYDSPYWYLKSDYDPRIDFNCITQSVYKLKFARRVLREILNMKDEEFEKDFSIVKRRWRLVENFEISK